MTQSLRERILQAMVSRLAPIALTQGATLIRSPPTGVTREQSPALLVFPESDAVTQRPNDRVERHLVVRLVAVAREAGGEAPATRADRLLVAAHAALFATLENAPYGEEAQRLQTWAGLDFDPERYDRRAANLALARMQWNGWIKIGP